MNDLFLKELPEIDSEFEKSAEMGSIFLPADSTLWVKEIITNFLQQFPYLQSEQIGVTWTKKDNDKGYAVGHLNVLNGSVPLIVNEFKLSPMDIFMINGESMPLNDYFMSKIYRKPEAFKDLETGRRRPGYESLFGSNNALQFSPTQEYGGNNGRTTRDAVKVASVIDRLSYIDTEDAMETISALKQPEVKRAFEKHGHMDLFVKIAERAKQSSKSSMLDDYFRGLEVDRQMVYSDQYGNSFVKQANSRVNKTWTVSIDTLDKSELEPILANDKTVEKIEKVAAAPKFHANMLKVGKKGVLALKNEDLVAYDDFEVTKIAKVEPNPEVFCVPAGNKTIFIEKTAENGLPINPDEPIKVKWQKTPEQKKLEAERITKTLKILDKKNSLSEEGKEVLSIGYKGFGDDYAYNPAWNTKKAEYKYKIAENTKIANSTLDFNELPGKEPQIGDFGVFLTKTASTEPFEVTGTVKMAGPGNYEITGERGFNKVAYYPVNVESEGFEPHESGKHASYVPKNAKFVKLSGRNDKMAKLKDFEAQIKVEGLNGFKKVAFYLTNKQDTTWLANEDMFVVNENDLVFADEDEVEKTANLSNFHKTHEITRDESGLFSLRGEEFAKYAQTNPIRNLNETDAKWAALHCGATENDIKKIASLKNKETYELEGQITAPTSLEVIENKLKEKYAEFGDKKLKISKNLVKIAAQFRDKMSVDAILSLNMLRKKNIQEYLAMLPTFQYVLGELAKLLLASRMGMDQTDPDAIKTALDSMTDVVIQLERLQAAATEIK